jgi:hypothetical protein
MPGSKRYRGSAYDLASGHLGRTTCCGNQTVTIVLQHDSDVEIQYLGPAELGPASCGCAVSMLLVILAGSMAIAFAAFAGLMFPRRLGRLSAARLSPRQIALLRCHLEEFHRGPLLLRNFCITSVTRLGYFP